MVEEALAVGVEESGHLLAADVEGGDGGDDEDAAQGEQPQVFQVDQSEGVFAESRQERPALLQRTAPAPTETRTYGYQGWQYYLASGAGPWSGSPLSWTYDKIGNRMSETRGGLTDGYVYTDNSGSTGDTALLDVVNLGVGGTRDYTFDGGGFLGQISAGANVLAYTFDAAGELASVVRGAESLTNTYDGRGFLSQASDATSGGYVKPTYSSAGLLLSQERLPTTGGTTERIDVLYFAGRPAAIWKKVGTSAATTTYVTTDPLGAPMFALNPAGTELWKGGFEPFGRDWQEGTANDALTKGIFLRLPGQWDDTLFGNATLGADSYYNVHRWYEQQLGRYSSPDPEWLESLMLDQGTPIALGKFLYANGRPLREVDLLGLLSFDYGRSCRGLSEGQRKSLEDAANDAGQDAPLTPACKTRPREKLKVKCGSCGGNCGRQFGGTICVNLGMNDGGECGVGPKCLASTILHEIVHSCGGNDRQSYACEKRFYGDTCRFKVPKEHQPTPECPEPCG